MGLRDFLPFQQGPAVRRAVRSKRAQVLAPDDTATLAKVFKIASLALGFQGGTGTAVNGNRGVFEIPTYDFLRILQAIDTDSFVKQGMNKYKELMWKEGWHLVGENPNAVDYVYTRLDFMELVMNRPIQDLLMDIGDQLVKFGNAFVVKSRGDITSYFPAPLQGVGGHAQTVVGYYLIPAETAEIWRDANNRVVRYRQNPQLGGSSSSAGNLPVFKPEDVIHFTLDRKPGRAFGTPFFITTIEDVVSLRQVEEDILNLIHRELFPLYKYTVGTPDAPAEPDEIAQAAAELQNLRTDGGLILPERHDVDVIGANGHELEAQSYLEYFRQRVIVGLGLAEHHLGITTQGANQSVTDRLDIALYDKVKLIQRYLEDMIRLRLINEMLVEGGYDPMINPLDPRTVSDRVLFKFKEIDVDTQIKKENQALQKYTADSITIEEVRLELGDTYPPDVDESGLHAAIAARMAPDSTVATKTATGSTQPTQIDTTSAAAKRPLPNAAGGDKARPANQHPRRVSPNVRHDDDSDLLNELVELIDDESEIG